MSSRRHFFRSDAYEIGEGNARCNWIPIAAAAIGAIGSYIAANKQAKATREAAQLTNQQNAAQQELKMWEHAQPHVRDIMAKSGALQRMGGFDPGPNLLHTLGRKNLLGYAEGLLPSQVAAAQASWQRGLSPMLDPMVGAMIGMGQRNLLDQYARNILPRIATEAQATGGYGGSRQGVAQGIAAEGLLRSMQDYQTRMLSDAYAKSLAQQRAAWGAAPSMLQLGFMPAQAQMRMGELYKQDLQVPARNLQGHQAMISPYAAISSGGGVAVPYTAGPNPYSSAIQGAGAGWSLGNMFQQGMGGGGGAAPSTQQQIGQTMQLGSPGPGTSGTGYLNQGFGAGGYGGPFLS